LREFRNADQNSPDHSPWVTAEALRGAGAVTDRVGTRASLPRGTRGVVIPNA